MLTKPKDDKWQLVKEEILKSSKKTIDSSTKVEKGETVESNSQTLCKEVNEYDSGKEYSLDGDEIEEELQGQSEEQINGKGDVNEEDIAENIHKIKCCCCSHGGIRYSKI